MFRSKTGRLTIDLGGRSSTDQSRKSSARRGLRRELVEKVFHGARSSAKGTVFGERVPPSTCNLLFYLGDGFGSDWFSFACAFIISASIAGMMSAM